MKLSVVIAGDQAPSSAFVVWRGFEKFIQKAKDYGYQGVELALKQAIEVKPRLLAKWLSTFNMEVSCISTGQVFASLGLYFSHPDATIRNKAIKIFKDLIQLAKNFGCMINVGRVRGFIGENQSKEEVEQLFINTIQKICDYAEKNGVTIVVEPINRYESNFINSLQDGANIIRKVKRNKLGLMPDTFHMNIEEPIIEESILQHGNLIKYFHISDSNRMAPGKGHLNFDTIINSLYQLNYNGWMAVEILPLPDPDTAALQAAKYMLPKIKEYNHRFKIKNL